MIKFSDCDFCKNSTGIDKDVFFCRAFPQGVPYEHANKDLKSIKECKNGIGYEPKEENNKTLSAKEISIYL